MSTYTSYTRQACNFVFPTLGTKITGEDRPRPGHFRIRDEDAEVVDEGKDTEKTTQLKKSKEEVADYIKAITNYINIFIDHLKDLHRRDKESGHTLKNDTENFFKKYEGSFTKFYSEASKKSKLFETLPEIQILLLECHFSSPWKIHPTFFYLPNFFPTLTN